jgi:hypothetical protein
METSLATSKGEGEQMRKITTRLTFGYDESNNYCSWLQESRWDFIHGQGWVESWVTIESSKKILGFRSE